MAHARLIRQNFYTDPLIAEKYKIEERYFLIGLACHADDFGRFWYNEASIRATIFPTDESITKEWIKTCLKKFIDDIILCEYEVNEVRYGHFPRWFQKGWFLKQRVDHPREYASPDCPLCETEKRKREISRAIKDKSIKHKKNKSKLTKDSLIDILTEPTFSGQMLTKYPLVGKEDYRQIIDQYYNWLDKHKDYDKNHQREFEGKLMGRQEILAKEKK